MTTGCGCTGLGPRIVRSNPPVDGRIRPSSHGDVAALPELDRVGDAARTRGLSQRLPSVGGMDRRPAVPTGWWRRSSQVQRTPLSQRPDLMARLAAASGCTLSAEATRRLLFDLDGADLDASTLSLVQGSLRGLNALVVGELVASWAESERFARPVPATDTVTDDIDDPKFFLTFAGGWTPPLDDDSRHTTLAGVWDPYWSDKDRTLAVGFDFSRASDCIKTFEASTAGGSFWDSDGGPAWKTVLHALRLIATYNDNIGTEGEYCPDARHEVVDWLFKYNWLRVKEYSGAGAFRLRRGSYGLPLEISGEGSAGRAYPISSSIRLNPSFLGAYADTTDLLLWQAHRATWYVLDGRVEGSIIGAIAYWTQATWLGDLALAAVAGVSANLIHEVCHLAFDPRVHLGRDEHCIANCCHERMAAKWMCRTAARCGLVQCNGNSIDYARDGRFWGSSPCREELDDAGVCASLSSEGTLFCWSCTMDNPGTPDASGAWTKGAQDLSQMDWTNPRGCP